MHINRRESDYAAEQSRLEAIAAMFAEAGFAAEHTAWLQDGRRSLDLLLADLSPTSIKFTAAALPLGAVRDNAMICNGAYDAQKLILDLNNTTLEIGDEAEKERVAEHIAQFSKLWLEKRTQSEKFARGNVIGEIILGLHIIRSPHIFRLCSNEPERVARLIYSWGADDRYENLRSRVHFLEGRIGKKVLEQLEVKDEHLFSINPVYLEVLLDRKDLLPLVNEFLNTRHGWADTIRYFDMALGTTGLGEIGEEGLNRALIENFAGHQAIRLYVGRHQELAKLPLGEVWQKLSTAMDTEETKKNRPVTQEYEALVASCRATLTGLSPGDRFLLLCSIREQLGEAGIDQVASNLKFDESAFRQASGEKIAWLKEVIARASRTEDCRHPLISRGIARLNGYEIEFSYLSDEISNRIGDDFFSVAEILGFHKGLDRFEAAPGPFYDPETGIALFELLSDAGMANLYHETGYTFHFNIQTEAIKNTDRDTPSQVEEEMTKDLFEIFWGLILSGAAHGPQYSKRVQLDYAAIGRLSVLPNQNNHGRYIEAKIFRVITKHEFYWTYRAATYLSWAKNAYLELCRLNKKDSLSRRELGSCDGGELEKQLARISLRYSDKLRRGLRTIGLEYQLGLTRISGETLRFIHEQQALAIPDFKSRFSPLPAVVGEREIKLSNKRERAAPVAITIDGSTYPTLVHFTREIISEAVTEILATLAQFEQETIRHIDEIDQANGEKRKSLLDAFLAANKVVVPLHPTWADKENAYTEVRQLFVSC